MENNGIFLTYEQFAELLTYKLTAEIRDKYTDEINKLKESLETYKRWYYERMAEKRTLSEQLEKYIKEKGENNND